MSGQEVDLQVRRAIYENFNDPDEKFTNDQVFEVLKKAGSIDPGWIIDDLEPAISALCDAGAARNIAQNFTTIWLMLFERLEARKCGSCGAEAHMAPSEPQSCPGCGAGL